MAGMSSKSRKRAGGKLARDYRHDERAVLRPEGGAQDSFPAAKRKPPRQYRHDSSLAPELVWDEGAARGEAERLINAVLQADSLEAAREAARKLKSLGKPALSWSGKAERERITVPSLPLFIHERLSTHAVLETLKRRHPRRGSNLELFGEGDKSIGEKIRGAYEHLNGWQNRMILGDSLQVMNSLMEYEGMGGKVQMVYMDPPYGIKFGSNFQPFVRRRDVKDGEDASISREPEMVQAYRDTWTLGVHSWLTYMRDRLLLAREMLTDSGSCFVQISDENVHHVREIMDEVFGAENFVSLITYRTTAGLGSKTLSTTGDYLVWYAKHKEVIKYNQIFVPKTFGKGTMFKSIEKVDGQRRGMNENELRGAIDLGDKPYRLRDLVSAGLTPSCVYDFEYDGRVFKPGRSKSWGTNMQGMRNLMAKGRLQAPKNNLQWITYWHDFPVSSLTNFWNDTAGEPSKNYVVQTSEKVVQRCMLMTTDPGDLVFDPTCGSGTTAYVAEQWGRRWITTDVSRVPLALARQRLLTATYPYYKLKDEKRGPAGGFDYKRKQNRRGEEVGGIVPHVTLRSIANDEPPAEEVLVDKPEQMKDTMRITGPFCVEAVLPTPASPDLAEPEQAQEPLADYGDSYIPRMTKALSLSPELRLPDNRTLNLTAVRPIARSMSLHAEAERAIDGAEAERIAVVFGPQDGSISDQSVVDAGQEARRKDYQRLLVVAFAIEPKARATVERGEDTFGIPATHAKAPMDLMMSDLLKNTRASQLFAITGLPDLTLTRLDERDEDGGDLWQVRLNGLDTFDPATMETLSMAGDDVPCWMLDTDYDGQCFRAGQIFFPRTAAWDKIRKAIRADFADAVWDTLHSNTSAPFIPGDQIAVKVLDDRGNELLITKQVKQTA